MSSGHNVATFAGAVGGSVGILALLAFGLFISIRRRRYLAQRRSRRERGNERSRSRRRRARRGAGYARRFTERDHGNADSVDSDEDDAAPSYDYEDAGDDDDELEEDTWGDGEVEGGEDGTGRPGISRQSRNRNRQPNMSQVRTALFVPRYFPGTLPASPPPYPAIGNDSVQQMDDTGEMVTLPAPVIAVAATTALNTTTSAPVSIPYRRSLDPAPPFTPAPTGTGHILPLSSPPAAYIHSTSGETNRTHLRPPLVRQGSSGSVVSMSYADRPPPTPPPSDVTMLQLQAPNLSSFSSEAVLRASVVGADDDVMHHVEMDVEDEILRTPLVPPPPPFGQVAQDAIVSQSPSVTATQIQPSPVLDANLNAGLRNTSYSVVTTTSSPAEPLTIFEHLSRTNSRHTTPASSIKERGSPVHSRAGTPPLSPDPSSSSSSGSSSENSRSRRYSLTSSTYTDSNGTSEPFPCQSTSYSYSPPCDPKFSSLESEHVKISSAAAIQEPPTLQTSRPSSIRSILRPADMASDDATNVVITESDTISASCQSPITR